MPVLYWDIHPSFNSTGVRCCQRPESCVLKLTRGILHIPYTRHVSSEEVGESRQVTEHQQLSILGVSHALDTLPELCRVNITTRLHIWLHRSHQQTKSIAVDGQQQSGSERSRRHSTLSKCVHTTCQDFY